MILQKEQRALPMQPYPSTKQTLNVDNILIDLLNETEQQQQ